VIASLIHEFEIYFKEFTSKYPWELTVRLNEIIRNKISTLDSGYSIENGIAIHKSATIEDRAILKAPIIISRGCFIGHNAYLRGGVYLGMNSSVGPACEVKTSLIFSHTEIAHLNFIGDSILGSHCNFEAGSILANYFNERTDKIISVLHDGKTIRTGVEKFGSLVGDNCKVGANAVLSPGSVLPKYSIIARLQLLEQIK
jgi:NDP-sugar pyrophosphorylase family protein